MLTSALPLLSSLSLPSLQLVPSKKKKKKKTCAFLIHAEFGKFQVGDGSVRHPSFAVIVADIRHAEKATRRFKYTGMIRLHHNVTVSEG